MNSITSTQDICSHLKKDKYAVMSASDLCIPPTLLEDKQQLFSDWSELEADLYLKKGSKFRFRRFNYFYFLPNKQGNSIQPFLGLPYYQSSEYNSYAGGIQRELPPFTDASKKNSFLHALIDFNFSQLPLDKTKAVDPWKVQVHQFRVITNAKEIGKPTPEGIHRDGVDFVFIYLIQRNNIVGGESTIYDKDSNILCKHTLKHSLDAIVVWDTEVLHSVSPIFLQDTDIEQGFRDVLLIGFTHEANLEPPK